jgi:hypothetical protein
MVSQNLGLELFPNSLQIMGSYVGELNECQFSCSFNSAGNYFMFGVANSDGLVCTDLGG